MNDIAASVVSVAAPLVVVLVWKRWNAHDANRQVVPYDLAESPVDVSDLVLKQIKDGKKFRFGDNEFQVCDGRLEVFTRTHWSQKLIPEAAVRAAIDQAEGNMRTLLALKPRLAAHVGSLPIDVFLSENLPSYSQPIAQRKNGVIAEWR